MCSLIAPCLLKQVPGIRTESSAASGCGFVDDALRAPAGLPWTTLRVDHRADLRPQAPASTTCVPEPKIQDLKKRQPFWRGGIRECVGVDRVWVVPIAKRLRFARVYVTTSRNSEKLAECESVPILGKNAHLSQLVPQPHFHAAPIFASRPSTLAASAATSPVNCGSRVAYHSANSQIRPVRVCKTRSNSPCTLRCPRLTAAPRAGSAPARASRPPDPAGRAGTFGRRAGCSCRRWRTPPVIRLCGGSG